MTRKKLGQKKKTKLAEKSQVEIQNWCPMVCTPAYDGKVDVDFCTSMVDAAFVSPLYRCKIVGCFQGNGAFIELARNTMAHKFLYEHEECTHLFFIDADLKFDAQTYIGLVRANLPICAGVYPKREEEETYPVRWMPHPEGKGLWFGEVGSDKEGFIMADRVPTGFLCISRKVVQELSDLAIKENRFIRMPGEQVLLKEEADIAELFYTHVNEEHRFVGEDYGFCDDYVRHYGEGIPVWPNANFVHAGRHSGNIGDYLARLATEEAEAEAS
jgi:hypothetical protein